MCYTINEIKEKAVPIAKFYGIKSLSLFGSYARGEADDESDIDLLIDKGRLKGLLQYFAFVHALEESFHCHIDVVTTGSRNQDFLHSISQEEVLLYEE